MIVPFFFTHPRILFSFFLFFAVQNDSEVRIEFSSKSNESIYIYTRIGRRTRVCTIRRNAHVDTEKEGGKLVGRWSPINLVIPNWECKIHAVRICASVRRDLSVRRSRWAGTASNLFVCFMDSGPDSAAAVLIRFPIFAGVPLSCTLIISRWYILLFLRGRVGADIDAQLKRSWEEGEGEGPRARFADILINRPVHATEIQLIGCYYLG